MHKKVFEVLFFSTLTFLLISCRPESTTPEPDSVTSQSTDMNYIVSPDGSDNLEIAGSHFVITTDNCGSEINSKEKISRERNFNVTLEVALAETLSGKLGGNLVVAEAEVQSAIEAKLGIQIGTSSSVKIEREIETPGNHVSQTTLQWEELWDIGTVTIQLDDEEYTVPYRTLSTLLLTQISKNDFRCDELPPGVNPIEVTPTIILEVPEVKDTVSPSCAYHKVTDEETLKNLIALEEIAVQNEDLSTLEEIFSDHAIYVDYALNKTDGAIQNYKFAFSIFDYQETDHPSLKIVQILDNLAYVSSGSSGKYIEKSSGNVGEYSNTLSSDHWYFEKDEYGCWEIVKLAVNASNEAFPP